MMSRQASWLRRWTRSESRRGVSLVVISRNTPMQPCQSLGHEEKLPPAKQRCATGVQTTRQGIMLIIKRIFRSCILHAIRKERPWGALTPVQFALIEDQADRPDRSKSHDLPKSKTLSRETEIPWPDNHKNRNYMTMGPIRRNHRLHHWHPPHLLPSSEERTTNQSTKHQNRKYQVAYKAFWRWASHF